MHAPCSSAPYHLKYAPTRLVGMANLPLQDPSASVDELHRAIEDLNLCGAAIGTSSIYQLDDPIYDSLYDVFESFEVPLFIHPAPSGIDRPIIDDSLKRYELDLMIVFSFHQYSLCTDIAVDTFGFQVIITMSG